MLCLRRLLLSVAAPISIIHCPCSEVNLHSFQPSHRSLSLLRGPVEPVIIPAHSRGCIDMSAPTGNHPVIVLTAIESALFGRLKEFTRHKNRKPGSLPCTMRVCGGWVRDKLLKKDNDDIDICLDTCSGQEFTTELKSWFDSIGEQSLCSSVGIVKASSEKSKHLETAIIRLTVTGEDVPPNTVVSLDFVQLRCETYADDSRVPEVRVASAEEDALRRDFTINAMYVCAAIRCMRFGQNLCEPLQSLKAFTLYFQVLQHRKRDC
jgi:hypothetical protein